MLAALSTINMRLDTQNRDLCERLALSEGRERALLAAFDRLEEKLDQLIKLPPPTQQHQRAARWHHSQRHHHHHAVAPASATTSSPSANGKNASDAATVPASGSAAFIAPNRAASNAKKPKKPAAPKLPPPPPTAAPKAPTRSERTLVIARGTDAAPTLPMVQYRDTINAALAAASAPASHRLISITTNKPCNHYNTACANCDGPHRASDPKCPTLTALKDARRPEIFLLVVIEINRWLAGALAAASAALMASLYWTIGKVGAASVPLAITKVLSDLDGSLGAAVGGGGGLGAAGFFGFLALDAAACSGVGVVVVLPLAVVPAGGALVLLAVGDGSLISRSSFSSRRSNAARSARSLPSESARRSQSSRFWVSRRMLMVLSAASTSRRVPGVLSTALFRVGAVVAGGVLVGGVVASSISTSVGVGAGARKVLGVAGGGAGASIAAGDAAQTMGFSPGARRENLLCWDRVGCVGGGAGLLGAAAAGMGGEPPGDRRENLLLPGLRGVGFGGSVIMTGEGGSK